MKYFSIVFLVVVLVMISIDGTFAGLLKAPRVVPNSYGCWAKCGHKGGYCPKQCGTKALCCGKGSSDCPKNVASVNPIKRHACVEIGYQWGATKAPLLVPNSYGCWVKCGRKGGYCPKQCGITALCCRKGYSDCPKNVAAVNAATRHACVDIGHPLAAPLAAPGLQSVYKFEKKGMTWSDAEESCKRWGGHLVTVTSKAENDRLIGILKARRINRAWIGYSDKSKEGTFTWITGSSSYNNWKGSEPNGGRIENCGEFITSWNGKWNDTPCTKKHPSICEKAGEKASAHISSPSRFHSLYKFEKKGMTWSYAEESCKRWGGHLVTVTSKAENDRLVQNLKKRKINLAWIGYNDQTKEGTFRWITGSGRYTNWKASEPNGGRRENCGVILPGKYWGFTWNGKWNDSACTEKFPSICEKASEARIIGETMDNVSR